MAAEPNLINPDVREIRAAHQFLKDHQQEIVREWLAQAQAVSYPDIADLYLILRNVIAGYLSHHSQDNQHIENTEIFINTIGKVIDRQLVILRQCLSGASCSDAGLNPNHPLQLFDNVSEIIYSYSPQHGFTFVSSASERLLDVKGAEFCRKGSDLFFELVHPDDRIYILSEFKRQIQAKATAEFEFRMFHKDLQNIRCLLNRSAPDLDADGEVTSITGILIDLTRIKKAAHEIQMRNKQLEFISEELRKTNQHLLEIDQRKSELINIIAHDLRSPLNSIRIFTELLLMYRNTPEEYEEFLNRIDQESLRLISLVDNFLDIKKIETGLIKYRREPTDIVKIINHFIYLYECEAEKKQVRLIAESVDNIPLVIGDQQRIGQVISNVLANALKFTPQGGRICIRTKTIIESRKSAHNGIHPFHEQHKHVKISIQDDGPGIPPQYHRRIFDKFFQIDGEQVGNHRGVGLGLAIAKEMVEHQGGRIWVEPGEEKGATISFTLPAEEG